MGGRQLQNSHTSGLDQVGGALAAPVAWGGASGDGFARALILGSMPELQIRAVGHCNLLEISGYTFRRVLQASPFKYGEFQGGCLYGKTVDRVQLAGLLFWNQLRPDVIPGPSPHFHTWAGATAPLPFPA